MRHFSFVFLESLTVSPEMIFRIFHCFCFPLILLPVASIIAPNYFNVTRHKCFFFPANFEMSVVCMFPWNYLYCYCKWLAINWPLVHGATPPSSCKTAGIDSSNPAAQSAAEVLMENGWMVKFIMQFAHKVVLYLCLCKVTTSTTAFTADRAAGNSPKKWLSYWKILQRRIYIRRWHSEQEVQL